MNIGVSIASIYQKKKAMPTISRMGAKTHRMLTPTVEAHSTEAWLP